MVVFPSDGHHSEFTLPLPIGSMNLLFYILSIKFRHGFSSITPGAFLSMFKRSESENLVYHQLSA
jgi:hypothetical protein